MTEQVLIYIDLHLVHEVTSPQAFDGLAEAGRPVWRTASVIAVPDHNVPTTPLDEAAKCALVSMDSTLKSNLSVGLPLDLVVYEAGKLQSEQIACIDDQNPYFRMVRNSWGRRLREVFESMEDPQWGESAEGTDNLLIVDAPRYDTLKKIHNPEEKVV